MYFFMFWKFSLENRLNECMILGDNALCCLTLFFSICQLPSSDRWFPDFDSVNWSFVTQTFSIAIRFYMSLDDQSINFFCKFVIQRSFLSFIVIYIVISNSHTMIAIFDQGDCHYWLVWLKFVFTLIANFRLWTQKCFGWWMKFVAKWIWWNVLRSLKGLSKLQVSLL